ncbi:phenylalanine--tRNA ligase subunit alpha [candidate division KSB3 bacterium]|uniref:Phenylalanine--tRNA ligase alpha subunit n=1 Tax=candidate division KSB3 bacterium TaxID=2044937 RepID=A0A2G6EAR0_9BACT|nr:MAG: phenylalanine--tRNA ligase subunit alpha [candidate division KSB3 bacterium]PIE30792.1 MAG: phenylalanine--tRNA ligase subunit alpha [candidate division KSB3 bacterium]
MEDIIQKLESLRAVAEEGFHHAQSLEALGSLRVKFLGKKSQISQSMKLLGGLPPDQRPSVGKHINDIKRSLQELCQKREKQLSDEEKQRQLAEKRLDITLPGRQTFWGRRHPLTQVMAEAQRIFEGLGFSVAEGPEVEHDYYNFEALNFPTDHPARDMQDTFFVEDKIVLRTHTSPVQIRFMEKHTPPVRFICPGKVYRQDADISHSPMFHQIEGVCVDKHVTMADLKGILALFCRDMFGADTTLRFRPSFFPFTEPSAEVDISCMMCKGKGCRVCGQSGWLEILGSGMIDPNVFKAVDYDPEQYSGYAFGMGVERIAMLKYGIHDIRLFFENDIRFLEQF